MYREKTHPVLPGIPFLLGLLVVCLGLVGVVVHGALAQSGLEVGAAVVALTVASFLFAGFVMIAPNEAAVLQLFGRYRGSSRVEGLVWASPFFSKRKVSLRVRNFESSRLKVNDLDGNPIEIAAVITWKVVDSAEACFNVESFESFVTIQSESALRNLATHYAYDSHDEGRASLRSHIDEVAGRLKSEVQQRLAQAGVEVVEARISHLAYAPEIAQAMLQRQQAGAIIAARQRIVEGAVGMVEMALDRLAKANTVQLDEDRKAAMVSNLLVVLCGERAVQPVVNTGTIYQ